MQCSVIGCTNHSNASECGNIVFYAVPKNLQLREKWIKIIDTTKVIRRTYVCSNHFSDYDFLASGKMRKDAVPALVQACRICLAVGTKLCDMNASDLSTAYEDITGLTVWDSNLLPHKLCWECAHRVRASWRLRAKARRSQILLLELAQSQTITTDSILSIDRVENNLISTLAHQHNIEDLAMTVQENDTIDIKDEYLDIGVLMTIQENGTIDTKEEYLEEYIDLKSEDENVELKCDDDSYLNEEINEINMNEDSEDERSVSPEPFTQNHIIVKPTEIKKESPKVSKCKSDKSKETEPKIDSKKGMMLSEKIFKITHLTIEEQYREIEKRKEKSNFKNASLKCMICYKVFSEPETRASHMIKHTDKSGTLVCDICKMHVKTRGALRKHVLGHTRRYSCKLCPYVTMIRNAARAHQKYHQGEVYTCPHCNEQFNKVTTYMSHVRIKHPSDFVCELCGNSFINEYGVAVHKKLKHRFDDLTVPPDGPQCEPCNIRFQSIQALNKHRQLSPKHSSKAAAKVPWAPRRPKQVRNPDEEPVVIEGPISCEQCDEKLPNASLYFHHFRRAHPDKNRTMFLSKNQIQNHFMCEVCGKMFQSLWRLFDHSHTHTTQQQFSCEHCQKKFQTKCRLVEHMKVHAAVRKTYGCPECGKRLSTQSNLQRHVAHCHKKFQRKYRLVQHMKLHAAVRKTYACPECGKRLSSQSNLQRHVAAHTGFKPLKCQMCSKSFRFPSERRLHIECVHLKKPWPKRNRKRTTDAGSERRKTKQDVADL